MTRTAYPTAAALTAFSISGLSFSTAVSAQSPQPGTMGAMTAPGGTGAMGAMGAGMAQMPHHSERFMMLYDTDGDGKVTVKEINDDQSRIFTAMDIDNDNSLSTDEMKRRGRSLQSYRTTTLFDLLDVNGDGKLSIAEVQAPTRRWFKRYDANKDGVMDAGEMPGRHARRGGYRRGRR